MAEKIWGDRGLRAFSEKDGDPLFPRFLALAREPDVRLNRIRGSFGNKAPKPTSQEILIKLGIKPLPKIIARKTWRRKFRPQFFESLAIQLKQRIVVSKLG